jgi:hypothetical protein
MTEPVKQKPRQRAPKKTPEERQRERRERFVRLAPRRVNNALRVLNHVANLGNRGSYSYTDEEAARIASVIYDAAVAVRDSFSEVKAGKPAFTL